MPRNHHPSYPRKRSNRPLSRKEEDLEDREPEAGDERISSAHTLRDDDDYDDDGYDDDDDDDDYDNRYDDNRYDDYGGYDDEDRDRRLSTLPDRGGDQEIDDVDIIEVLDDDPKHMGGPDA
jgi:hypothetical protein